MNYYLHIGQNDKTCSSFADSGATIDYTLIRYHGPFISAAEALSFAELNGYNKMAYTLRIIEIEFPE